MAVQKLDKDRYFAYVYGDEVGNPERPRRFMQDGMYFDGAGIGMDAANTPKPAPVPTNDPVSVVELAEEPSEAVELLNKKSFPALKKIAGKIHAATDLPLPKGGPGAKARLVKYIAENTE